MKIEDNLSPAGDLRSGSVGRAPETRVEGRAGERKAEIAGDRASLSTLGLNLAQAIEQEQPAVLAKIARLREAVQNGTYAVPNSELSASIVAAALREDF